MDSFSYGKPARGPRMPRAPKMPSIGRPARLVGAAVVALVLALGLITLVKRGGEAVVQHEKTVVKQIDSSSDIQAQSSLNTALMAAQTASMESGSYRDAGPDGLASVEPSLQYVTGPSTGPTVVSVAATETDWAAAVLSSSGTCFAISASGGGDPLRGAACTGQAAMSAP